MAVEIWAPVPGYENAYSVSTHLRVRSEARTALCRGGGTRRVRERILRTVVARGRYARVTLSRGGRIRRVWVHVLVREAFGDATT